MKIKHKPGELVKVKRTAILESKIELGAHIKKFGDIPIKSYSDFSEQSEWLYGMFLEHMNHDMRSYFKVLIGDHAALVRAYILPDSAGGWSIQNHNLVSV